MHKTKRASQLAKALFSIGVMNTMVNLKATQVETLFGTLEYIESQLKAVNID
jgi:hypothetical protein